MALNRTRSTQAFEVAKSLFPGGVNSPVRAFKSVGGSPLFFAKGKGSHVWDVDDVGSSPVYPTTSLRSSAGFRALRF